MSYYVGYKENQNSNNNDHHDLKMLKNSKKCLDSVNEVRNCSLKWIDSKLTRNKKSFFGTTYAFGKTINTHLIGQLSKNYTMVMINWLVGIYLLN